MKTLKCVAFAVATTGFMAMSAQAAQIGFDFVPPNPDGGVPSVDDAELDLNTPYVVATDAGGSVELRFGFDTTGNGFADTNGVFEKTGPDGDDGYLNDLTGQRDVADPAFTAFQGDTIYRSNAGGGDPGALVITYNPLTGGPITSASGIIWDIDAAVGLGNEQWLISAFDTGGGLLDTILSPVGEVDPSSPLSLDAAPWAWGFDNLSSGIARITVEFVGTKTTGIGLAFDAFSPDQDLSDQVIPVPASILLLAPALLLLRRRHG